VSTFQSFYRSKFPDDPRSIEQVILSVGGSPEADEIFVAFPGLRERYDIIRRRNRPSLGEEFKRGVLRGTDQLQATLFGAGQLAADLVGADGVSNLMAEGVARNEAEAAENPASVSGFRDVGNVGDALRLMTGFAGEAVPSAAESLALGLAGGVIGTAVGGPAGGVSGGATGLVGGTVTRGAARALVRQGVSRGARIGTGIGVAAASVPPAIGEIYNETGDPGVSLGYGALAGALDMLPEAFIVGRFFKTPKVGVDEIDRARSYAKEFAAAALNTLPTTIPQEALTESAQEFINIAAAKDARGESPFSVTQDDIDRMINAGIAGVSGGALFAGPAAAGDVSARSRGIAEVRAERDAIAAEAEEQARIMQANQEEQAKLDREAQQATQRAQEMIREQQEAESLMEGPIGPQPPARDAFSAFDAASTVLPSLDPIAGLGITETADPEFDLVEMTRQANLRDRLAKSRLDTPVGRATSAARAASLGLSRETYQAARNAVAAAGMLDRRRRQQLDAREAMIRERLQAPPSGARASAMAMIEAEQAAIADRRIAGSPINAARLREELARQEAQDAATLNQGATQAQGIPDRQRAAEQEANRMAVGPQTQADIGVVGSPSPTQLTAPALLDAAPTIARPLPNEQTIPRPTPPRPAQQATRAPESSTLAGGLSEAPTPTGGIVAQEEISASEASSRNVSLSAVMEQASRVLAPTDGIDGSAIYVPTIRENKPPTVSSVLEIVRPLLPDRAKSPTAFAVAVRDNETGRVYVRSARLSPKDREPALDAMKGKRGSGLQPETGQFPVTAIRLDVEKGKSGTQRYTPIGVIEMKRGERVVAFDFDTEQQYREMPGVASMEASGSQRGGLSGFREKRSIKSAPGKGEDKVSFVELDALNWQPQQVAWDGGPAVNLNSALDEPDSLTEEESMDDGGAVLGAGSDFVRSARYEPNPAIQSAADAMAEAIAAFESVIRSGGTIAEAQSEIRKIAERFLEQNYKGNYGKKQIEVFVAYMTAEAAKSSQIKNTFRYQPEVNLLSPARANELLRAAIGAARDAGADVVIMERGMSELITAFEGRGLDGRGLIGLSANHILKGNDSSLAIQALHEVAHTFVRTLSPEQQNAFHNAIDLLGTQERRWLMNPASTDVRLIANAPEGTLSPIQQSVLAGLTPQEITSLRQTEPSVLLVEQAAEHLAMLGVSRGLARTTMDRIIRLFKSVMHSVAMRVSRALGVQPNPAIIVSYVENQFLRFINRDFARISYPLHFPTEIGALPPIHDRVAYYTAPDGTSGRARLELSLETGQIMLPDFVPQDSGQIGDYVASVMRRIANNEEINGDATIRKNPATIVVTGDPVLQFTGELASINRVDAAYRNAFQDSYVRRLTGDMSYDSFLSKYIGLGKIETPASLTEALRQNAEAVGVDLSSIDAKVSISDLPKDNDGRPSSVAEIATERALTKLQDKIVKLRDDLITEEKNYKKQIATRDRNEKSKVDTSQRTKDEITRLSEEIPRLRAVIRAVEIGAGSLYKDLNVNPTGLFTPETPMGKFKLYPGASYRVPKFASAEPQNPGDWTVHSVPMGLDLSPALAAEKTNQIKKIIEWIREPNAERHGSQYNNVQSLLNQLTDLVIINGQYSAANFSLMTGSGGPIRRLASIGTPAFKYISRQIGTVLTNITKQRQKAETVGRQNNEAYRALQVALNMNRDTIGFRRIYDRISHELSLTPSNITDRIGYLAARLGDSNIEINTEKKRKALRDMVFAIDEGQKFDAETFALNKILVKDQDATFERNLVRRGAATLRIMFTDTIDRAYSILKDFDKNALVESSKQKSESGWQNISSEDINANLIGNVYAYKSFTLPIINNPAIQFFVATPSAMQPVNPDLVREIWQATTKAGGGVDAFAVGLHNAMRSEGDQNDTVSSVRSTFGRIYDRIKKIKSNHEQANNNGNSPVLARQMMDARDSVDFPFEWIGYNTYDPGNNQITIRQAAVNGAFGRDSEFLFPMMANAVREVEDLRNQAAALAAEGFSEKQIINEMGEDKYRIQQRLDDVKAAAEDVKASIPAMMRTGQTGLRDMQVPVLFLRLMSNLLLALSPRSALFNIFDLQSFLMKFGVGKIGISSSGTAIKEFSGILTNMLTGWNTVSDTVRDIHKSGLTDQNRFSSVLSAISDAGPARMLDEEVANERLFDTSNRFLKTNLRRLTSFVSISTEDVASIMAKLAGKDQASPINENKVGKFRLFSIFGNINEAMQIAAASSYVKVYQRALTEMFSFLHSKKAAIGAERFSAYLQDLNDGSLDIMGSDGFTQGMNEIDRKAYEALAQDLYTYMPDGTMSRFAVNAWQRTGGNIQAKNLLTDRDLSGIVAISNTEISLQANEGNAPMALSANPWVRSLSTFLVWPYLAAMRTTQAMRDPSTGKITLPGRGNQGPEMGSAARFVVTMMLGVLPATMAASLLIDLYDEEVLGKKSNIRPIDKMAAVPGLGLWAIKDDWQAGLERFARFSPTGLIGEIANELLGQDDARNGGLSIDGRVFTIAYLRNWADLVSRITNSDMQATYSSIYRPILMQLGARGPLEVTQIVSNYFGLDTAEARYNERINVGNTIRGAGRTIGLEARRGIELRGGAISPVTPWLAQMELTAIANDRTGFRNSYRMAVQKALEGGRTFDEAETYVKSAFSGRHPLRRVFATQPSEVDYRKILGLLNDRATESVTSAIRNYNKYIESLGGQAFYGRKSSAKSLAKESYSRRPMSIAEAQALAARAASGVDFYGF
jgi:hypothetical protein